MVSMSYCRHENTLADLEQVWEMWERGPGNEYEAIAREALVILIREMAEALKDGDEYADEDDEDDDDDEF